MAYFSNETEGEGFYENWCRRCIHDVPPDDPNQCSVWMLHLLFNGTQYAKGMTDLAVRHPHPPHEG